MELRPYQEKTIKSIREKMKQGFYKRIIVPLPTDEGENEIKTIPEKNNRTN